MHFITSFLIIFFAFEVNCELKSNNNNQKNIDKTFLGREFKFSRA